MKVSLKSPRAFTASAISNSLSRSIKSILFSTSSLGFFSSVNFSRMASVSSLGQWRTSITRAIASASPAPPHAVVTIARSSRRLGAKSPGVSTRMICVSSPTITIPRIRARVVCTLRETIETLAPTNALTSVDLPALGAPIKATKPQRVSVMMLIHPWQCPRASKTLKRHHVRQRVSMRRFHYKAQALQ